MGNVEYETIIGLEIHTELSTRSKMFCGCAVAFGGALNTRVCPVCLGLPGSLPVANEEAVERTVLIGLALNCAVAELTQFHRKNYFYPDMPKNYQISQYNLPICTGGQVEVEMEGYTRRVGITRVHMEEDTGKLLHVGGGGRIAGADYSQVDFNRAGTPLVEIVTEPDIRTADEAKAFVQKLKSILETLEVSDCNMEEGSLRVDANISIRPVGSTSLGTKVEIKNMNSFRALHRGLVYEAERQTQAMASGGVIVQETRHWDADQGVTSPLRSKEEAHDYRYFPEPDLVPMALDRGWVSELRGGLPELPDARRARLIEECGLSPYDASVLTASKELGDYYERAVGLSADPKTVANWVMGELLRNLNANDLEADQSPITADSLVGLVKLIDDGTISGKIAKQVFEEMWETRRPPGQIVEEKGLVQISDESAIEAIVDEVLDANPQAIEDIQSGNQRAVGFLVGKVMKETKGKANPGLVNKLLQQKIQVRT